MKKTLAALAATAAVTSTAAFAQSAMDLAIQGNYCRGLDPVAAEFLPAPDGRLKVTCPAGALSGQNLWTASGLRGDQAAALALAGVGVIIAFGGGDDSTTTTTTTGSGS